MGLQENVAQKMTSGGFRYSPAMVPGLIMGVEAALVAVAGLLAAWIVSDSTFVEPSILTFFLVFQVATVHILARRARLYELNAVMRPIYRADDVVVAILTAVLLMLSIVFSLGVAERFPLDWIGLYCLLAPTLILTNRAIACRVLARLGRRKTIGRSMAVLGVGEQGRRFLRHLGEANPYFVNVIGVFHDDAPPAEPVFEGKAVLGGVEALLAYARRQQIDDVVVALPWNAGRRVSQTVETLKQLPVNVYLSTDLVGFELAFRPVIGGLSQMPMFEVVQRPISGWSSAIKAVEDYVLASALLILLSPLLLIIAIMIRLDSPGPVFFMQARLGFNNKEFHIYKFRSMYHRDTPETEVRQARRGDPRVTRVGRFIRATSLDELPQLLNVLDGTMSLVGPRPHALSHNEEYGARIRGYFARHRVKPGITGWAQVNGLRGETDTIDMMEARIRHDIYYAENWSVFFDLKILIMTALVVLFQSRAY